VVAERDDGEEVSGGAGGDGEHDRDWRRSEARTPAEAGDEAGNPGGSGADGKPAAGFRGRRNGFTGERRAAFVAALARYGTVKDACRVTGVSDTTFYRHEKRDAAFAEECRAARAACAARLDAIAWERATVGAEEQVIRGGAVVEVRRKPSDAMLRLVMQASDPERYGPTMGRGGGDEAAYRRRIEAELRPRIEAEMRARIEAEVAARPPRRLRPDERRKLRAELMERLSEFNLRMGGAG
jgi:hypothetical protein